MTTGATPSLRDRIANWFQQNRERLCGIAVGLGIPDSATMAVPVVEFGPDQSSTGRLENRSVSPYLVHQVELEVACAGVPVHGDQSVSLARAITDDAGAGIRFFTVLGPGMMAQRVQDPSVLGDLDDPDPVVFALALLDLGLSEYLRSLHALRTLESDHDEALRVADEFLAFAAGSSWTTLVSVPVAGLATSTPLLESGPVVIRQLSPEEGGQLGRGNWDFLQPRPPGPDFRRPPDWWNGERHVIEVRTELAKTEAPNAPPTWKKVVLALQLEGFPIAGPGFGYGWQEPGWLSIGRMMSPVEMARRSEGEPRELTAEDLVRVLEIVGMIDDDAVENPRSPQQVALRRFSLGTARSYPGDSLVDYVTALEGLLLPGDDRRELSFRFEINGAVYLGETTAERREIKAKLKHIYNLRSGLVHGRGKLDSPTTIADGARDARELARSGLVRALQGWPSQDAFLELLFRSDASAGSPSRSGPVTHGGP